jgi:hypothetical protein
MAVQDIQHFSAPNGDTDMRAYPVTASQTFVAGEPVVVIAAGTLSECADDPSAVTGIAAHKSTDVKGASLGTTHPITVYRGSPGQIFKTRNFATDGGGTAATPTLAHIGDYAGLDFTSGTDWFLDTGQNNLICEIVGVRDAAGNNLGDPRVLPGTGVWVLFTFV